MDEDGLDDGRVVHVGDDPATAAAGTGEDVHKVDSAEQGRPIDPGAHRLDDGGAPSPSTSTAFLIVLAVFLGAFACAAGAAVDAWRSPFADGVLKRGNGHQVKIRKPSAGGYTALL